MMGTSGFRGCWAWLVLAATLPGGLRIARGQEAAPQRAVLKHIRTIGDARFRCGSTVNHILALPGAKAIVTTGSDGEVYVWDAATRKQIHRFIESHDYIWDAVAVPGTNHVLVADHGGHVHRYDLEGGKKIASYRVRNNPIRLAVHPDGDCVAVVGGEGACSLLDLADGKILRRFKGLGRSDTYTVRFAQNGQVMLTGGADDTLRLWDMETGKAKVLLTPPMIKDEDGEMVPDTEKGPGTISTISPGPNQDQVLIAVRDRGVMLWDIPKAKAVWKQGYDGEFCSYRAVLSPDGGVVASIGDFSAQDGRGSYLTLLDPHDGKILSHTLLGQDATCYALAFSPDGQTLYCGVDRCVMVYSRMGREGKPERVFPALGDRIYTVGQAGVDFLPGGKELVTGDETGVVFLDARTGRITRRRLEGTEIFKVAGARDAAVVGALSRQTLHVVQEGKPKAIPLPESAGSGCHLFLSPDGATIAMTGYNYEESVSFLSAQTGKQVGGVSLPEEVTDDDESVFGVMMGNEMEGLCASCTRGHLVLLGRKQSVLLAPLEPDGQCVSFQLGLYENDALYGGQRVLAPVGDPVRALLIGGQGRLGYFAGKGQEETISLAEARERLGDLSSKSFRKRQAATKALADAGPKVAAWLGQSRPDTPEARTRLRGILDRIRRKSWKYSQKSHLDLDGQVERLSVLAGGQYWVALVRRIHERRIHIGALRKDGLVHLGAGELAHSPRVFLPMPDGTLLVCNANGTISYYRVEVHDPAATEGN
jgi:WD40 repeat protein